MALGRPRTFDKQKALDVALALFWQYGYEGASVAKLAGAMGINVPSLYAAFGNKQSLYFQALERYSELNGNMYHDAFKQKTAREVAQYILDAEVELVTREYCPDGCFVVQSALITSEESEEVRRKMNEVRFMPVLWMEERFRKAKKKGDLPKSADPAALAHYIMTVNCGLAVQAKSGASREELKKVVKVAMQGWPS